MKDRCRRQFRSQLMVLPEFEGLTSTAQRNLGSFDRNLVSLRLCGLRDSILADKIHAGVPPQVSADHYARVSHRLCPYLSLNSFSSEARSHQSRHEYEVLTRQPRFQSTLTHGYDAFWKSVGVAHQKIAGGSGALRNCYVATAPDNMGNKLIYPSPDQMKEGLRELFQFFRANLGRLAAFQAIVGMMVILNCHPFTNGNGRISRLVFNWILRDTLLDVPYVPLYELSQISAGGFLLRSREAQYFGNWDPICEFLLAGLQIASGQ